MGSLPAVAVAVLVALALASDVARAQERLTNGEFDTNLSGWTNLSAPKVWSAFDDADDPSSGSVAISNTSGTSNGQFIRQCVGVLGGADYGIAYSHYTETVGVTTGRSDVTVDWHDNATCAGTLIDLDSWQLETAPGTWTDVEDTVTAPNAAVAAFVRLTAFKTSGAAGDTWRVYYDHVQLVPEPESVAQLAAVGAALALLRRRRAR